MADFGLWNKETLVKFAEEASARITQLEADLKLAQEAWRQEVAKDAKPACEKVVASDTVRRHEP
jgi:hypothetical protein